MLANDARGHLLHKLLRVGKMHDSEQQNPIRRETDHYCKFLDIGSVFAGPNSEPLPRPAWCVCMCVRVLPVHCSCLGLFAASQSVSQSVSLSVASSLGCGLSVVKAQMLLQWRSTGNPSGQ